MTYQNPKTHECPTCGYVWNHGKHGGHSCSDRLLEQNKALKARVTELEVFADKVVNWNEQFSIKTRCDIGSLGQQQHFQHLALQVLHNEKST